MVTLRAGLSGCGAAGAAVHAALRGSADCEIVAVHDSDPARLDSFAGAVGTVTSSFAELLGSGVDFVIAAGPAAERLEQVRSAAEQAVPVLLHTPMAATGDDGAAMLAVCDAAETKLGVLVPAMADPVLDQVRAMFADGWFGGLVAAEVVCGDDALLRRPAAADDPRALEFAFGGDAVLGHVAAAVHLLVWATGRRVRRVAALASRSLLALPRDRVAVAAELSGDAVATLVGTRCADGRTFALHGTDGSATVRDGALVLRGERPFDGEAFAYDRPGDEVVLPAASLAAARARLGARCELVGRFARWLEDTDGFPCPGDQALQDLRAVTAVQRALVRGSAETV